MGKRILVGLIAVVVLAAAGVTWLVMSKGNEFVASAIETYVSAATGTSVSVGSVELALTQGRGDVKGLTIGNPPGYSSSYFLKVDDIKLTLDLSSLAGRVPVVKEAVVEMAHLNAEQHGQTTNLTDIEQRITGPAASKPKPQPAAKDEGRVIVDRFRLTHGSVTLTSDLLKHPEDLALADVSIDGIGRASGGVTYDQAAEAVLDPILSAARTAVETRLRKAAEDAARDKAEGALRDRLEKSLERN
jgi:autotransporter translocation and assembly factor TamB